MMTIPSFLCFVICFIGWTSVSSRSAIPSTLNIRFPMMFQFGDSLSDTGNSVLAFPNSSVCSKLIMRPPYGQSYFKHPTGRNCDGRLIVDFLAQGLGLSFLHPYLATDSNFTNGIVFSVGGGTAVSQEFYRTLNLSLPATYSLDTQLGWFLQFRSQLRTAGSVSSLEEALYVVGEVGGNDYVGLWMAFKDKLKVQRHIPMVVKGIEDVTRSLYAAGGRRFLIVNLPLQGCSSAPDSQQFVLPGDDFDEFGCQWKMRQIGELHNIELQSLITKLQAEFSDAKLWLGDFYNGSVRVMQNPELYGFENMQTPCTVCASGARRAPCRDPSKFIYWNENHYTEHFYQIIANEFLSTLEHPDSTFSF